MLYARSCSFSISTTLDPATGLGFLLHTHPGRLQSFEVSLGTARRIRDFGCGEGMLVADLLADRSVDQVVAVAVSARTLDIAGRKLRLDRMPEQQRAQYAR
jgi:predicted TPR repeat methyltransferase